MYGSGIAKGLWLTFRHFIQTYVDDFRYGLRKYSASIDNFAIRQGTQAAGAFTVQYPDEKVAVPERFRFVPFLVVEDDDHPDRPGKDWCTSCGICAKVCPPQCIWIVRSNDPVTGRPVPEPQAFFIDTDICMNCGLCAEYCPFDAIKMDHDYELASFDRTTYHIHDKERLSKPLSYWNKIAPTRAYEEAVARGGWDHKDVLKEARKSGKAKEAVEDSGPLPSYEETRLQRREIIAMRAAQAEAAKHTEAVTADEDDGNGAKPKASAKSEGGKLDFGDEETRAKRREAALARKAARAAKRGGG